MQNQAHSLQTSREKASAPPRGAAAEKLALDEYELASRWGMSVRTLRRWRQEQLGCVFLKLGARVIYPIAEIEAFERRVSRHSTFARAYA